MAKSKLLRGIAFAFIAGPTALLWLFLSVRYFGHPLSSALFALGSVVVHPLFVGNDWRCAARASALAAALGLPVLLLSGNASVVSALSLVVLGIVRSAVLFPRPLARALAYELFFLGAGLLALWLLHDGSAVGIVFSAWAFWLLQAGFVLMPSAVRAAEAAPTDAFDRARAAAEAVLEGRAR